MTSMPTFDKLLTKVPDCAVSHYIVVVLPSAGGAEIGGQDVISPFDAGYLPRLELPPPPPAAPPPPALRDKQPLEVSNWKDLDPAIRRQVVMEWVEAVLSRILKDGETSPVSLVCYICQMWSLTLGLA